MYLTVPITTDDRMLVDNAVARLQNLWPDWTPSDGNLEVVLLETIASMAADAATAAAQVPDAVFEAIVEELHGIIRRDGTPATTTATFTVTGSDPVTIPAGSELDVDGWAFVTDIDVTAAPTATGVPITAVIASVHANGLTGDKVSMVTALAPIIRVVLDSPTGGGADGEEFFDYRNRAILELQLQATTLVTVRDYELMSLSLTNVGRVLAISDWTNRAVVVYPLHPDGTVLTATEKTALATLLDGYRETNWLVSITDPTFSDIDVTYDVVMYPGNLATGVKANIDAALAAFLDPATWGQPTFFNEPVEGSWLAETTVRLNKLIDIIGSAAGVNYVIGVTIAGTNGTTQPNGDFLMTGVAPLARARTLSGVARPPA